MRTLSRERIFGGAIVLAILALLAAPADAATPVTFAPFGALGIEGKQVKRVQRWLRAAATSLPEIKLRRSTKLRRQLARTPGCDELPCIAKVGRRVGATHIIVGHVGSIGGAYVVYLQLLRDSGTVTRRTHGLLDPRRGLRAAARQLLFRLLLPDRYSGKLAVNVNVSGSWVYLDGERVGRGPKLKLPKVSVGTHALRITHEAHRDYVRFVKIPFGRTAKVSAKLERIEAQATEMKLAGARPLTDAELPWYRRWWAVAAFGAVIVAATTTAVVLSPKGVDRDLTATVKP
ncbi:MAG: hypothetical protein CSB49_06690 [Proteobacteria bacterium]|nr:MAG: hypothetical protein CSB49_06690 [Pseudomonadota bacterium]